MGCFPQSGGCEHKIIRPFITYLNDKEGSDYLLEACLDVEQRTSPQPEALYRDSQGKAMVVERKSMMWPLDYAQRHDADHYLAGALAEKLGPIVGDAPALLEISAGISVNKRSLDRFAEWLAQEVQNHIEKLKAGEVLTFGACRFRFQADWERDEWEPTKGLGISWLEQHTKDLEEPEELPSDLFVKLQETIRSVKRKFAGYSECRQVLLLEAFGELEWKQDDWWSTVLRGMAEELQGIEVWLCLDDSFEDGRRAFFWNVYTAQERA